MTKKFLMFSACAALAVGLLVVNSSEAAAQCGYGGGHGYGGGYGYGGYSAPRASISIGYGSSYRGGYGHGGYGHGGYGHGGYGHGGYGHGGYGHGGHGSYHPTSVYRHRDHLHVQPGHFHSRGWR